MGTWGDRDRGKGRRDSTGADEKGTKPAESNKRHLNSDIPEAPKGKASWDAGGGFRKKG